MDKELNISELNLVTGGASLLDVVIGIGVSIAANAIYDSAKSGVLTGAVDTKAAGQWLHSHPS